MENIKQYFRRKFIDWLLYIDKEHQLWNMSADTWIATGSEWLLLFEGFRMSIHALMRIGVRMLIPFFLDYHVGLAIKNNLYIVITCKTTEILNYSAKVSVQYITNNA